MEIWQLVLYCLLTMIFAVLSWQTIIRPSFTRVVEGRDSTSVPYVLVGVLCGGVAVLLVALFPF